MEPKTCRYCNELLRPHPGEAPCKFRERVYCSRECMKKHYLTNRCSTEDGVYLPSQEEIREACKRIQASWTDTEERNRAGSAPRHNDTYSPPVAVKARKGRVIRKSTSRMT